MTGDRGTFARWGWLLAALATVTAHLCLSARFPQAAWITPGAWIAMYVLALAVTVRESQGAAPEARWRWRLVAVNFSFSIAAFFCILYAEYVVPSSPGAMWLNDLLGHWRGLALLLALCTPEETERPVNRVLDVLQTVVIAFVFLVLFSPGLLAKAGGMTPLEATLVNRYGYTQSVILALLALLAVFTAKTGDSRLFHRVLAIYLWIGVPVTILSNHLLTNTWMVPPASALYVLSDLCLLAYVAAVPLFRGKVRPKEPSRRLVFLRLGASAFLPLFGILASMLLAVAGHHPVLGVATGLASLALYGVRSTYGQYRLLSAQWDLELANQRMELANHRLEMLSQRDPLTGLYNRRWFSERFALEWKLSQRSGTAISLLLLDVDHFKLFNDTRGHAEGDRCLQAVSKTVVEQLHRSTDALVRYGGEEFVAMLPNTDADGAQRVAERMMEALAELRVVHTASPFGVVTVSIGGATCYGQDGGTTADDMLLLADAALYEAKNEGRNRIRLVCVPAGAGRER